MTLLEAAFLGLVQGLTEFLPISSSGHLVLFERLLGVKSPGLTFEITVHAGTMLAVIWVYADDLRRMAVALGAGLAGAGRGGRALVRDPDARLALLVLAATVPTGLIGLSFKPVFESLFDSLTAVAFFWLLTGILLWIAGRAGTARGREAGELTLADALFVGVMQGVAIAPGLSRSGTTIAAGLLRGLAPGAAARFSFLLSLPAVAGATLLDIKDIAVGGSPVPLPALAAGAAVAAVTGVFAIRFLLRVLAEGRLRAFAYYVWALGLAVLAWQLV